MNMITININNQKLFSYCLKGKHVTNESLNENQGKNFKDLKENKKYCTKTWRFSIWT